MMMSLGMFVFSLPTLAYQDLARKTGWRHAEATRVGARAASQFVGPGADTITLGGLLVPDVAGTRGSIDELRAMGDKGGSGDNGEGWPLVDGTGKVLGAWRLDDLSETQTLFFQDGVPRKTDFSLTLTRVDEPSDGDAAGAQS